MKEDFRLIVSMMNPNWVDVVYPTGPKYMINVSTWTCTCMGDTMAKARASKGEKVKDCKHLRELASKTRIAP